MHSAAVPATVAFELALLARAPGGGDAAQAAFAATLAAVNLVGAAARFLVSGVSAQAGAAAARRRRGLLAARARVAVVAAGLLGLAAASLLLALRAPAFAALRLSPAGAAAARPYWGWRAASIPPALLAQAAQGILQGCGWLGMAAGLAVVGSLAEAGAAWAVLRPRASSIAPPPAPLPLLGRAALAVALAYAVCALAAAGRAVWAVPEGGISRSRAASRAALSAEGAADRTTPGMRQPLLVTEGAETLPPPALPSWRALASDFASGSLSMFARSLTLQLTFFLGVVVASRAGTATLAAHGVCHTLWMLCAYALDGAETAATVLGCRVAALGKSEEEEEEEDNGGGGGAAPLSPACRVDAAAAAHARLARRCVGGSALGGLALGAALAAGSPAITAAFLHPGAKARSILAGRPLAVLAAAQVVNGPAYAVDGLLASLSLWGGGALVIGAGFIGVYAPLLAAVAGAGPGGPGIAGIWGAKLALNVVRVVGGLALVRREWRARAGRAAGSV